MRGDKERLLDIKEAIERIEKYISRGKTAFESDELLQIWILHHLQIIGEAARSISSDLKEKYPAIPWVKMIGMRNVLVHSYFGIDINIIWSVIEHDLNELKDQIINVLGEM